MTQPYAGESAGLNNAHNNNNNKKHSFPRVPRATLYTIGLMGNVVPKLERADHMTVNSDLS